MIFHASITTSANTAEADYKETSLKVVKGLVYKITIYFPPGSRGLLGVQIFDKNYQVYPTTIGEWFTGDNIPYNFEDTYYKLTEPFNFIIKTYNTDELYEHKVNVMVGMVSEKIFIARYVPTEQYKVMKQILREIAEEQRQAKKEFLKNPLPIGTQTGQ